MRKQFFLPLLSAVALAAFSFQGVKAQTYCTSVYSQGCFAGISIDNFSTTGGQQNVSNLNSGCPGGNSNSTYTGGSIAQTQGQSINVSMSGPNQQGYKIWVDWNSDGDFTDAGEDVFTSSTFNQNGYSGSFTVPGNATIGSTTLRVRTSSFSHPVDPCSSQFEGETEDYTFIVNPASSDDAGISVIDTPTVGYCSVPDAVWVRLTNGGTSNLNSADINWEVNGVSQPVFNFAGTSIVPSGESQSIFLGNYPFQLGDVLKVYTSNPNGNIDVFANNDTLLYTIHDVGLSGTYTVNPTGSGTSNFISLNDALVALEDRGVCGPVVFSIADGLYQEQLLLQNYPGLTSTNNVTFQSASNDTAAVEVRFSNSTGTSDNYVVGFESTSAHYNFKAISFSNFGGPVHCATINFFGNNEDISFDSCKFMNYPSFVTSSSSLVLQSGDSLFDVSFTNNLFRNGSYGALLSPGAVDNRDISLVGNTFIDFQQAAAAVQYSENVNFSNNDMSTSFQSTSVNGAVGIGVYLTGVYGNVVVERNHLVDPASANWSYIGFAMDSVIGTSSNPALFRANRISMTTDGAVNSFARNVRALDCKYVRFEQNSFYLNSSAVPTNYAIQFGGGENNALINNAFSTSSASRVISIDTVNALAISDNNAFQSDSAFGTFGAIELAGLQDWTTYTSLDSHSVEGALGFFTNVEELKVCDTLLAGKGQDLTWFTHDYNGDPAVAGAYDIGADQFTEPESFNLLDTTFFCTGDQLNFELYDYDSVSWNSGAINGPIYTTNIEELVHVFATGKCGVVIDSTELILNDVLADFSYSIAAGVVTFTFNGDGYGLVTWDFGDGTLDTGRTVTHIYSGDDSYAVSVSISNNCGTDIETKNIVYSSTGVNELESSAIRVFPNPSNGLFMIETDGNIEGAILSVYDLAGKQIITDLRVNNQPMDLKGRLDTGYYILHIQTETKTYNQRLIIK